MTPASLLACLGHGRARWPPHFDDEPAAVLPAIELEEGRGRAPVEDEDAMEPAPTTAFDGAAPNAVAPVVVASTTAAALGAAQLQADAASSG